MAIRTASRFFSTCTHQLWHAEVRKLDHRLKRLRDEIYNDNSVHSEKQKYLRSKWSDVWQNIDELEYTFLQDNTDGNTRTLNIVV